MRPKDQEAKKERPKDQEAKKERPKDQEAKIIGQNERPKWHFKYTQYNATGGENSSDWYRAC